MADRATNKTAEAIVICISPDVCKTPMGPSLVPVPYPIIAKFDAAQATATKTNFEGNPAFHMGSFLPQVQGDEAGVGGGVISNLNMGCCRPIQHSSTLRTEGQWVIRHNDLMEMNCAGPKGPGNTKGKIIFLAALKASHVNPDGSIEYVQEESCVDENGNAKTERIVVKQSADGTIQEVSRTETTLDSVGNVEAQQTSYKFDSEGNLTNQEIKQAEYNIPPNTSRTGPLLGEDAIGKPTGDGRVYLGDGMYAPQDEYAAEVADAEIPDDHTDIANDSEYQQAQQEAQAAQAEKEALEREQMLDAAQAAADVAGVVDPTPVSDAVSAGISLGRGDFLGAGLSVISMVPYLGDAIAKPIKGAKAVAKATELAAKLKKAADKLKKAKEAAEAALKKAKEKIAKKKRTKPVEAAEPAGGATDGGKMKESKNKLEQRKAELKKQNQKKQIDEADAKGKDRPPHVSKEDSDWLNSDPRNKELAYDPDTKSYKIDEAKAALKAEADGALTPPVTRDIDMNGTSSNGGDIVDGNGQVWDAKGHQHGSTGVQQTIDSGENVMVHGPKNEIDAIRGQVKPGPNSGKVVYVPTD